jgi:hypothetical protein
MEYDKYFPGVQYCDVLALDAYNGDFAQSYYDTIAGLSQGKVMALAEVGNPPTPEVLTKQLRWSYYMIWSGFVEETPVAEMERLYSDPRVLTLDDPAYWTAIQPYRTAVGFPPLRFRTAPPSLTGAWVLDRDRSTFESQGRNFSPTRMQVVDGGSSLSVTGTRGTEFDTVQPINFTASLDGSPVLSQIMGNGAVSTGWRSPSGVIQIDDERHFGPGPAITTRETWALSEHGQVLVIDRDTETAQGLAHGHLIYLRE